MGRVVGDSGGRPIAGLLADLKQRDLLKDTLVVWGGEFGRLPVSQKSKKPGRDHNPHCFTTWMAGGGAQGQQPGAVNCRKLVQ